MLELSTSGYHSNDFVDDTFIANLYNVVVGAVNAVRSFFGHRGKSSSWLLDYGKIRGCKEVKSRYISLDDFLLMSPWEGLSAQNLGHWWLNM